MQRTNRILIYRLGSIGDAVVALPCFHLVRRRFPAAEIALLTNQPIELRTAPMEDVLGGSGLVDRFIDYPVRTRSASTLLDLRRKVRAFAPDLLVYLVSRTDVLRVVRDWGFFRLAGVKSALGFPYARDQRMPRPPAVTGGLWETEANRLARCLSGLGNAEAGRAESWDLHLSVRERDEAVRLLAAAAGGLRPLGLALGTKQEHKDWGNAKWRAVIAALADSRRALVLIGGGAERERSAAVAEGWPGPVVNLCGCAEPRVSAAALERLAALLCVDSGPMHLAAAVGTRCVAVFSRGAPPGQWFPYGPGQTVLYPRHETDTIAAIQPSEVIPSAAQILMEVGGARL